MSKSATIRKITVDGDVYGWCVTSQQDIKVCEHLGIKYQRYRNKVAVWPITYQGNRRIGAVGPDCEVGHNVAVTPRHVANFIKANKEKF